MKNTRKKHIRKRKTSRNRKGGLFDFFKSRTPDTQEELNNINTEIGNIKLKNYESVISEEINKLSNLRNNCITSCKTNICSGNDEEMCKQINDMMTKKTDYEWGNLCNTINVLDCKSYLRAIKKVEVYTNYIKNLNDVSQKLLSDYKNSIIPKI
jgi:hypothetical protein